MYRIKFTETSSAVIFLWNKCVIYSDWYMLSLIVVMLDS